MKKLAIVTAAAAFAAAFGFAGPAASQTITIDDTINDTDNEEIDVSEVRVHHDGDLLTCEIDIATTNGLLDLSTFSCYIDFDDEEVEADVKGPDSSNSKKNKKEKSNEVEGCDANNDGNFIDDFSNDDVYRLGSNQTGDGPYCTTSDIALTFSTDNPQPVRAIGGGRGKKSTGGPNITSRETEFDAEDFFDFVCDGDVSGANAVSCTITLTMSLDDIADARDAECTDASFECLTNKDLTTGDYDVFMFFDSLRKSDRDRVRNTFDNNKPSVTSEAVIFALTDPTL